MKKYRCKTCNELHDISDLTLGAHAPDHWEDDRHSDDVDSELTDDQCVIEGRDFFIRGCLDIPLADDNDYFRWGVWTTLSEENFQSITKKWNKRSRTKLGPHFGWLSTTVPGYPDTLNLKTLVHHQPPGIRPQVEILECDHILYEHFSQGVPIDFLMPILHPYLAE